MMNEITTKALAESTLREIPAVMGVSVREDIYGHPREVHLLVTPGPNPRELARAARDLLQERLGIEVDQRVISIAQLAREFDLTSIDTVSQVSGSAATGTSTGPMARVAPELGIGDDARSGSGTLQDGRANISMVRQDQDVDTNPARVIFQGLESRSKDGKLSVRARISWRGTEFIGEGDAILGEQGRLRAAATATLNAATAATDGELRIGLESVAVRRVMGREYAIIIVRASAPALGRQPVSLIGAQPIEFDAENSAALATLHATNRILSRILK